MAEGKIIEGNKKTIMVPHVIFEKIYVLTLTEREAESLRMVLCAVGGSPNGRRGDIDQIKIPLNELGLTRAIVSEGGSKTSGSVTFNQGE